MFRRQKGPVTLFEGSARGGREIVREGQIWAFAVLVVLLALLTSPLWLFSPPAFLGTKEEFRMAGAAFWLSAAVLAIFAGRSWGLSLRLHPAERTVSREHRSPWTVKTLWSYSGDRVRAVNLTEMEPGVVRLEASLQDGSSLLIERGIHAEPLRQLGNELARCWGVPFKS